jgi:hypothetical protein
MRCTTFQDGSNWSILEGVCEPRSTPSSVKGVSVAVAPWRNKLTLYGVWLKPMFDQYMALHNDWPISDRYWAISRQKHETFFDWLPVTRVNNDKCIIDMHIILVRVIHSIPNSCIKYSTQNQHFAEMFTYSDDTNYNLNFYYFIVSIYLWFHLFGNYSYASDVGCNFRVLSSEPSFDDTTGICAIVAVVDTRRVLRARETTARGVHRN